MVIGGLLILVNYVSRFLLKALFGNSLSILASHDKNLPISAQGLPASSVEGTFRQIFTSSPSQFTNVFTELQQLEELNCPFLLDQLPGQAPVE